MGQGSRDEDIASALVDLQRHRTMRWHSAEVGPDDRTIAVRFKAQFDDDQVEPRLSHQLTADELVLRLEMIHGSPCLSLRRDVFPAPPTHARELTITVVDIVQGAESIERGRVTVALADGSS